MPRHEAGAATLGLRRFRERVVPIQTLVGPDNRSLRIVWRPSRARCLLPWRHELVEYGLASVVDSAPRHKTRITPGGIVAGGPSYQAGVTRLRRAKTAVVKRVRLHLPPTGIRAAIRTTFVLLAIILVIAGAALAQLSSPSASTLQSDDPPSSIRGTVVNAVTQGPIAHALVASADERFATFTDGEGHFEFDLPKSGGNSQSNSMGASGYGSVGSGSGIGNQSGGNSFFPFWVSARKPGFLEDSNRRNHAIIKPGTDVIISLLPEALIKGRILLSDSDAALGVSVQLLEQRVQEGMPRWNQRASVQANSSGEFRFAELRPGIYKLVTNESMDNDPAATIPGGQQYGFSPVYYPGAPDFASAGTIHLAAGESAEADIPLTRQAYYPVRIPVANAEQSGLNISVSLRGHRGPGYSLGYNASKQRIEGSLPNGHYLVEAATYGQNSQNGSVNIAVAGAPVDGPAMALGPSSSIDVHVVENFASDSEWRGSATMNVNGRSFDLHGPRLYLNVNLESVDDFNRQNGGSLRNPTGPDDESLVLENVAPGRYWVRLHPNRGYVASATMGGIDLLREPLSVVPASRIPIEIKMRDDTGEIDGTVMGMVAAPSTEEADGSSGPHAWVACIPLPESPGQYQQLWVSSDGKFNATTISPGTYHLLAFAAVQLELPYRDPEAMRAYDGKGQVVHVSAGEKASVQLQIIPGVE